jgi:tetrahydromethanopterin S-methyltransferase subunit G
VTDQYRILGRLEAQQQANDERLDRIEAKVDALTEYVTRQKGGMRVAWAIAAAGGVIGVSLSQLGKALLAALKGGV